MPRKKMPSDPFAELPTLFEQGYNAICDETPPDDVLYGIPIRIQIPIPNQVLGGNPEMLYPHVTKLMEHPDVVSARVNDHAPIYNTEGEIVYDPKKEDMTLVEVIGVPPRDRKRA